VEVYSTCVEIWLIGSSQVGAAETTEVVTRHLWTWWSILAAVILRVQELVFTSLFIYLIHLCHLSVFYFPTKIWYITICHIFCTKVYQYMGIWRIWQEIVLEHIWRSTCRQPFGKLRYTIGSCNEMIIEIHMEGIFEQVWRYIMRSLQWEVGKPWMSEDRDALSRCDQAYSVVHLKAMIMQT